ncbi:hypothetical protein DOY81_012764 [Sarcophaga bullata]|nr:hypothetical protein DOY81_012764 [Sarcophaga bullata]
MDLFTLTMFISSCIYCTYAEQYELEFRDTNIFSPCDDYPDNSIHSLFDMSNLSFEKSSDFSIEIFRKERGGWQPTHYSQKRSDTCVAYFNKAEAWSKYFRSTPEEQQTCPFQEGQRLDFDISEPTYVDVPDRNRDGEYKIHFESGNANDGNFFVCIDVFATLYKV